MKTHIRALLREGIDGMTNEVLIGKFVDFVVPLQTCPVLISRHRRRTIRVLLP